MDGHSLLYNLSFILQEAGTSSFMDTRGSYNCLYEAAKEFAKRANVPTSKQTITIVTTQTTYNLNPDFMHLFFRDFNNDQVIRYTVLSSSQVTNLVWRDYDMFSQGQSSSSVPVPSSFTICDKTPPLSNITGLASSDGALTYEETALIDTTPATSLTNAYPGDSVHNITDGSSGIITEYVSATQVKTVLFGGTNNYWTSGDSYVVVPQNRKVLVIDPPPLNSGDTITVDYVQTPNPVFSSYRSYRIDSSYEMTLCAYAAFLYKYRDRQPQFGDALYQIWEAGIRKATQGTNKSQNKNSIKVNLHRRSLRDRSYR